MNSPEISAALKREAKRLGFSSSGICPAITPTGLGRFAEWLSRGYGGTMRYLTDRADAYSHPRHVLDQVRSIVMLTMQYQTVPKPAVVPGSGRVSSYAWGERDYHDVIHERLKQLADFARRVIPDCRVRGVVDTAPLLEREFARLAGLGWIGKNTLLLNKQEGSWFFLAALLVDIELEYDEPFEADHCGTCRACLDACPTSAFPEPYVLDATRCISYLTIELRGPIAHELRRGVGNWLFGCDVCQEVCPWNNPTPVSREEVFRPTSNLYPAELAGLFELDDDQFRALLRRTPLWRAKRRGILRNAAIVLGNQCHEPALDALKKGLTDKEPVVRGACAWALGRYQRRDVIRLLKTQLGVEQDEQVRHELVMAMKDQPKADAPDC